MSHALPGKAESTMATAQQLKALLKCYSEGDGDQFLSVAMQIAAHAARSGKGALAQELRDLVDDVKRRQQVGKIGGAVPIARPTGDLAGLLSVSYPKVLLSDMVLGAEPRYHLERVLREYRQQHQLREHGLSARRKLLLLGPPGCGKTMTASALAGELKLPLFSVQLHSLITKFMGETAAKLHSIFSAIADVRGVYLFDEFDAIGANRGSQNDVGEIRRVLNSFLQFLEQDDSESIVIAATNYVGMLDDALFRRFDDVVRYSLPSDRETRLLIQNELAAFHVKRLAWKTLRAASQGLGQAEVVRACRDAAKDAILGGSKVVTTRALSNALRQRRREEK
jgi:AAA+ superfamily predicted ATPase